MGILANDGDHPSLFGDYRGGNLVERFLFATTPRARTARSRSRSAATSSTRIGSRASITAIARSRACSRGSTTSPPRSASSASSAARSATARRRNAAHAVHEQLTVGVVDVAGHFDAPIPGARRVRLRRRWRSRPSSARPTYVRSDYYEQLEPDVAARGRAASRPTAAPAHDRRRCASPGAATDRLGRASPRELEVGYASGDANPYDGDRATLHVRPEPQSRPRPLRRGHALADGARGDDRGQIRTLVARATPGLNLLPSNGGVFGATIHLSARRCSGRSRWIDLKVGAVDRADHRATSSTRTTSATHGERANYDGGDPAKHDLGIELDGGFDVAHPGRAERSSCRSAPRAACSSRATRSTTRAAAASRISTSLNSKLGMQF